MNKYEKVKTDNIPLLDEVVYYLKRLATESVIKNQYKADKYETLDSIKKFDLYKSCYLDTAKYQFFDYEYEDLLDTSATASEIVEILDDKMNASEKIRGELLKNKKEEIIDDFVELNNYYRMLNGQPDVEDLTSVYVDIMYLSDDDITKIDTSTPIDLLSENQQQFLNTSGIIDIYINMYPNKKYLKYIGDKKIDLFTARNAKPFGLLYTPKNDIPIEVYSRWIEKYNINRDFTMKTFYDNNTFIDENDHYDDFIAMLIVLQTVIDIISELPDFIIKRDIFDLGTIKLILQSYDVDYFPNIPLNYQKAIVRNINTLIEFKSTELSIINICSLFGFDNIDVFKYYLFKSRNTDENGNFIFNENELDNYTLKFIKCPIDDNIDNYLYDKSKYLKYDDVTYGDQYWDAGLDHKYVENRIKEHEFNYIQSKYYSIDCVFSMTDLLFKLVYFYNMIFDDVFSESLLSVNLYSISDRYSFKLVDVFCYLFALGYIYYGLQDNIIYDQSKILKIKGFDFNVDMSQLNDYIYNKTQGKEDNSSLGIDKFVTFNQDDKILSYSQLSDIFINNKNIYDYIVNVMFKANNKREYDLYKKIYDSLMITDLSEEFFRKSNGEIAESFTDFLKDRDQYLYESIINIKTTKNPTERQELSATMINDIIYVLEHQYLNNKVFDKIYKAFPTTDADSIVIYIKQLIEFFKSYKIQLDQINILYVLDDKYENICKAIDNMMYNISMNQKIQTSNRDRIKYDMNSSISDRIGATFKDSVYIYSEYFKDSPLYEIANKKDCPFEMLTTINQKECASGWDYVKIVKTYN